MTKNWRTALAAWGIVPKVEPTALFEIDDANGKKLVFPEVQDLSGVIEGVTVTAEDGDYVYEADGKVHTITVLDGKVTAMSTVDAIVVEEVKLTPETAELLQAFADQFASNEKAIAELKESFTAELTAVKAMFTHGDDNANPTATGVQIGGRKIDFNKLNLR